MATRSRIENLLNTSLKVFKSRPTATVRVLDRNKIGKSPTSKSRLAGNVRQHAPVESDTKKGIESTLKINFPDKETKSTKSPQTTTESDRKKNSKYIDGIQNIRNMRFPGNKTKPTKHPVTPAKLVTSAKPVTPLKPVTSAKLVTSAKPVTSTKPVTSINPVKKGPWAHLPEWKQRQLRRIRDQRLAAKAAEKSAAESTA